MRCTPRRPTVCLEHALLILASLSKGWTVTELEFEPRGLDDIEIAADAGIEQDNAVRCGMSPRSCWCASIKLALSLNEATELGRPSLSISGRTVRSLSISVFRERFVVDLLLAIALVLSLFITDHALTCVRFRSGRAAMLQIAVRIRDL